MQLDKGRLIVLIIAAVSIAVWMIVFPMVIMRGPAGAFSGDDGGVLCVAGGEKSADNDVVRFVRRFFYLGVRSEVRTGEGGELCFVLSFARRLPAAAQAVLRKGELRVFPIHADQSKLFPLGNPEAAGLVRRDAVKLGPTWTATSSGPVRKLIAGLQGQLPGVAYPYCRHDLCTAVLVEADLVVGESDVMAAYPIKLDNEAPALLVRLSPPALQRITAMGGGPTGTGVKLAFVMDDRLFSVAMIPPPEADGQIKIPLDPHQSGVEFEAAIMASLLTTGPIDGNWTQTELRLAANSKTTE